VHGALRATGERITKAYEASRDAIGSVFTSGGGYLAALWDRVKAGDIWTVVDAEGNPRWENILPLLATAAAVAGVTAGAVFWWRGRAMKSERDIRDMMASIQNNPTEAKEVFERFINAGPGNVCMLLTIFTEQQAAAVLVSANIMSRNELQRHVLACAASANKTHAARSPVRRPVTPPMAPPMPQFVPTPRFVPMPASQRDMRAATAVYSAGAARSVRARASPPSRSKPRSALKGRSSARGKSKSRR